MKKLKLTSNLILLFTFLWSITIYASSDRSTNTCQEDDYIALRALYLATDGDNWDNSNWPNLSFFQNNLTLPSNVNVDNWWGVNVDANGCVTSLSLGNLVGVLPPEIGNLSKLTYFSLYNSNQISGNLPPEIGNLSDLTLLNLSNNEITGSIPPEIGNLVNLEELRLGNNELNGTIPPEIGNLIRLKYFAMSGNNLTGIIPAEISNLDSLTFLNLASNQLNGIPPEIGGLSAIEALHLSNNQFAGTIPPEIGNLSNLAHLTLNTNQFSGAIPAALGNLSQLSSLWLHYNQLSGNLPAELGNLTNLFQLYLNNNQLSGCFDINLLNLCEELTSASWIQEPGYGFNAEWEDFCFSEDGICPVGCQAQDYAALRDLYLDTDGDNWSNNTGWPDASFFENTLTLPTGIDISTWYGVTVNGNGCVAGLNLSNNNLSGTLSGRLGSMSELTDLQVNNNQLVGCYDPNLLNLCYQLASASNAIISNGNDFETDWEDFCSNQTGYCLTCQEKDYIALRALYLSTDGDNWEDNTNWPNTVFFNANQTLPSGVNVADWYGITVDGVSGCVTEIEITSGNMTGNMPMEIGLLENLLYLNFEYNDITGTIPLELFQFTGLTYLNLGGNKLTGIIPPEIGNLVNLRELILHNNDITGTIPPEIGNLTNLVTITMYSTLMGGNIPSEIGNLSSLEYLEIGFNQFTGNIPPELGNLTNLYSILLGSNQLTGSIPRELGMLENLEYLQFVDNNLSGCYHPDLLALCGVSNWNDAVSGGNNMDADWDDFCGNMDGICPTCEEAVYPVLRALYLTTDGDNWTNKANWPTTEFFLNNPVVPSGSNFNFDTWYGITASNEGCVKEIKLSNNNLTGILTREIGYLDSLNVLELYDNQLSGCFDANLSTLCTQLNPAYNTNASISDGNNFTASWEDFCNLGTDACPALTCQEEDYLALRTLYLSTDGDNWDNNTNWLSATLFEVYTTLPPNIDMNTWEDVTLDANGCVSHLQLSSNNLTGSIPPAIGNLSRLERLVLSYNELSGEIPSEIGNLTNLEVLEIRWNELTGFIPATIGNLTNLNELDLTDNELSGFIPPEIGNLTNLNELSLSANNLGGVIPTTIGNLTNLVELRVGGNQLSGNIPAEIGNLNSVETIILANNQLEGSIPPELGYLENLMTMNLSENQLSGCFDPLLVNLCHRAPWILTSDNDGLEATFYEFCNTGAGACTPTCADNDYIALRALYLNTHGGYWTNNTNWPNKEFFEDNPVLPVGTDISTWYGIEVNVDGCVTGLNLSNNNLSGNLPSNIASLNHLTQLQVFDNQLNGCYESSFTALCNQLDANYSSNVAISNGNNFDTDWENFCNNGAGSCNDCGESDYTALRAIYLSTNGDNWSDNTNWPNAAFFNANPTPPAGIDISSWEGITLNDEGCLSRIYLAFNSLSGTIPPEAGNIKNLTSLSFRSNNLAGTIPSELGNLDKLESLHLGANQLSGIIPSEIGNLFNLQELALYGNELTGPIIPEIVNLLDLTELSLSSNQLTGPIIPEISNLIELRVLGLRDNQFSGDIPAFLGSLPDLFELYLSDNQLTGCYDLNLKSLCSRLFYESNQNYSISDGNNLDASWSDFCGNNQGICPMALLQSDYTALSELYLATDGDNWSSNLNWPNEQYFIDNPTLPAGTDVGMWQGVTTNENGYVTELDLSNLSLMGNIPPEIGNLLNLVHLDLSDNQLMGGIPPEIGDLRIDMNVDASGIPQAISDLTHLEYLNLSNNLLTGTIPIEIGNLTNLTELYLYNNEFSGCYEENLMSLCTQLEAFDIDSGNNFDATWQNFCDLGTGSCIVGIIDALEAGIKVYPSPADEFVIFETDFPTNQIEIMLYDTHGRRIMTQILLLPSNNQIDIRGLSVGVYFYQLHIEKKIFSGKILIE